MQENLTASRLAISTNTLPLYCKEIPCVFWQTLSAIHTDLAVYDYHFGVGISMWHDTGQRCNICSRLTSPTVFQDSLEMAALGVHTKARIPDASQCIPKQRPGAEQCTSAYQVLHNPRHCSTSVSLHQQSIVVQLAVSPCMDQVNTDAYRQT